MAAVSCLRSPFHPWLSNPNCRFPLSSPNFSLRVLCFRTSSSSSSDLPSSSSSSSSSDQSFEINGERWESFRKKKVVMRVGYVGTDYRGNNASSFFCTTKHRFRMPGTNWNPISLSSVARIFTLKQWVLFSFRQVCKSSGMCMIYRVRLSSNPCYLNLQLGLNFQLMVDFVVRNLNHFVIQTLSRSTYSVNGHLY